MNSALLSHRGRPINEAEATSLRKPHLRKQTTPKILVSLGVIFCGVLLWGTIRVKRMPMARRLKDKTKPEPIGFAPGGKWGVVEQASWESFPASDPPAW